MLHRFRRISVQEILHDSRFQKASLAILALAAAGIVAHSVFSAFYFMHPFPYWDMVSVQAHYFQCQEQGQPLRFLTTFFKDNEHLNLFPMTLYYLDNVLFQARGVFLIACTLVMNALLAVVLALAAARCARGDPWTLAASASLFAALLFWLIHWENLIWPKQVHMYVSLLCFIGAALLTIHTDSELHEKVAPKEWLSLALTVALLTISTFSFGYGLVAWCACLCLVFFRRWPASFALFLSAAFLATVLVYLLHYDYKTLGYHQNPFQALLKLKDLTLYVVTFLLAPVYALLKIVFVESIAEALSGILCVAMLGKSGAILYRHLARTSSRSGKIELFVCLLLLFTVGTAVLIGLSRLNFGRHQAMGSRYAIVPVLFWIGLCLYHLRARKGPPEDLRVPVIVGGIFVLCLMMASQRNYAQELENIREHLLRGEMALLNGSRDEEALKRLYPHTAILAAVGDRLRNRNWSYFSREPSQWLGKPVAEVFGPVKEGICQGWIEEMEPAGESGDTIFVQGWAWSTEARRPFEWVVLADEDGRIQGLARSGVSRRDVRKTFPYMDIRTGWEGYVKGPALPETCQAFAVLEGGGGGACPLHRLPGAQAKGFTSSHPEAASP